MTKPPFWFWNAWLMGFLFFAFIPWLAQGACGDPGPGILDIEVWAEESFEWRWAGVHDIVAPWWHDANPVEQWRSPLVGGR